MYTGTICRNRIRPPPPRPPSTPPPTPASRPPSPYSMKAGMRKRGWGGGSLLYICSLRCICQENNYTDFICWCSESIRRAFPPIGAWKCNSQLKEYWGGGWGEATPPFSRLPPGQGLCKGKSYNLSKTIKLIHVLKLKNNKNPKKKLYWNASNECRIFK